jgi:hypothetical protein
MSPIVTVSGQELQVGRYPTSQKALRAFDAACLKHGLSSYQKVVVRDGKAVLWNVPGNFCEGDSERFSIAYRFKASDGELHDFREIMTPDIIEQYLDDVLIRQEPNPLGAVPVLGL